MKHLRRMNTGPNMRDTIRKAFEFALDKIGLESDSTEIWQDYVEFLKTGEVRPYDEWCCKLSSYTWRSIDHYRFGRLPKSGCNQRGVSSNLTDPDGWCHTLVGGIPGFRKRSKRVNGACTTHRFRASSQS